MVRSWLRSLPWKLLCFSILPIGIIGALIHTHWVGVPYLDQWEIVPLFQAYHQHTLNFGDFWTQHNEHRLVFPRLVMLGLAIMTHWNVKVEMLFSLTLAIGIWLVLLAQLMKTGKAKWAILPLGLLIPWILFSPVQWENWLWGWQLQWFMMVLATVSVIYLLASEAVGRAYWWRLSLAAVAATIGTYSLGNGILIWPVALGIILALRKPWRYALAWIGFALPLAGAYFIGYTVVPGDPSLGSVLLQPAAYLQYLLILIGRPLGYDHTSSSWSGLMLLLAFATSAYYLLVVRRQPRQSVVQYIPWVGLGTFALLSALITTKSRFDSGVDQAMSSRYYAITSLLLIAAAVLAIHAFLQYTQQRRSPAAATILLGSFLLFAAVFNNYFYGVELMGIQENHLKAAKGCLNAVSSPKDDCLLSAYPKKKVIYERLQYLRSIHWGGF